MPSMAEVPVIQHGYDYAGDAQTFDVLNSDRVEMVSYKIIEFEHQPATLASDALENQAIDEAGSVSRNASPYDDYGAVLIC